MDNVFRFGWQSLAKLQETGAVIEGTMRKKEISIKDVAKLDGVSPTTVSRVINDSDHPVSARAKKSVQAAICQYL